MKNGLDRKDQRGFTLVEVIVVAIIVAALAAVAIPLYNNYVATSKNNAAANAAGSLASFMGACLNQQGTPNAPTSSAAGPFTVTCTLANNLTTTIQIPAGINAWVSSNAGSGTATANGGTGSGLTNQTYSY